MLHRYSAGNKIIDDLMIHRTSNENTVWLVVNAACKEKDINHLRENLNKKFESKMTYSSI